MASEAIPNDETVPLFVFDSAVPAMGGGRILNRRRQWKDTIAGMAHSYTRKKGRVSRELPWCFPGFPQKTSLTRPSCTCSRTRAWIYRPRT